MTLFRSRPGGDDLSAVFAGSVVVRGTGVGEVAEAIDNLERRGVRVMLCEANRRVLHKLVRAGLVRRGTTPARYYRTLGLALTSYTQN